MKVTGTTKTTQLTGISTGKSSARSRPSSSSTGAKDDVSISEKSSLMQALEVSINEAPEVDLEKIESIKQAISEGSFSISSGRIAEKMLASASEFLAKKKA